MGTKSNPGKFDAYENAAPDEPMFVLLGRDPHAALLVRLWALLRTRSREEEEKIAEALKCAADIDAWPKKLLEPIDPGVVAAILIAATTGMDEHPEDYDGACDCDLCRSYA